MQSRQGLAFNAKMLRKLYNKESQPALKKHYERQYKAAELLLTTCIQNDSGYKSPRNAFKKCPQVAFDPVQ